VLEAKRHRASFMGKIIILFSLVLKVSNDLWYMDILFQDLCDAFVTWGSSRN
jgi:hypothetical protein